MATQETHSSHPVGTPADAAYRRAWSALALYPLTFALAFAVGEALVWLLTAEGHDPRWWVIAMSAIPAAIVFSLPGVLTTSYGARAARLGRSDGALPALVGVFVAVGVMTLNLVAFVAKLMVR